MRKIAVVLLAIMLLSILVGCGAFSPPTVLPDPVPGGEGGGEQKPEDTPPQDDIFSVTLVMNGQPFYPTSTIFALWTGEEGVHRAVFNEEGVAEATGLDGEYHVTLSGLPVGYTYDPNGYFADNTNMDITVEVLHIISSTSREDTTMYNNCVGISSLGTYRTTLTSASHKIWFEYTPSKGGIYSIESWVDTTENMVNPYVDIYNGTFAFKQLNRTQNDGGSSSTYTKNFRFEWSITASEVGNLVSFVIYADCIGNNYPVTVDFTIKYEGDVPDIESAYTKVHPEGPFLESKIPPSGQFHYLYEDKVLSDDDIVFNEDDGYYHIYNSETGEQGAVLYATIGAGTDILDGEGAGFKHPLVVLKFAGYDYYEFIEWYDFYSNTDKRHPVTEELKQFMYLYAHSQHFFYDGNGWAEGLGINSTEEDQWLFNCGYYI